MVNEGMVVSAQQDGVRNVGFPPASQARRQHQSEQESTLKSFQILLVHAQTIPGTRRNALALDQFHGMLP